MKLVVFDLDGTLLHTLVDLTNAVNVGLGHVDLPTVTEQQLRAMVGNGAEQLIARASGHSGDDIFSTVYSMYNQYYNDHYADNTYPYDGVIALLDSLAGRGISVGVFSNKNDKAVKLLAERHFGNRVQWAIGTEQGVAYKPDPFGLIDIMQRCGADNSNTVYVGDSIVDIATASNGGVPCICVDWGYNDIAQLLEGGAECIVSTTGQLLQQLLSM